MQSSNSPAETAFIGRRYLLCPFKLFALNFIELNETLAYLAAASVYVPWSVWCNLRDGLVGVGRDRCE